MYHDILEKLHKLEEEKYRNFSTRLLPNISDVRGIRLPLLQKLAKEISKGDVFEYFSQVKHTFFEETLLMGFVIGNMELKQYSIEKILFMIESFVPHINNWSTCDSFCSSLKIAKKEPVKFYNFLQSYAVQEDETIDSLNRSEREYELRFFIVMCLDYYINDLYIDRIIDKLREIQSSHYYVNMALSWAYSKIYLTFPDKIMTFLEEGKIKHNRKDLSKDELFIHNKTIFKICDSYQVFDANKFVVRSYLLTSCE